MKTKIVIWSCILAVACTVEISAQQVAPFKKGDRVAFVGNSITDGGHYHSYIWLYYMTHYPTERMWMANCGIGGDTGKDILNRFDDDVVSKKPNVLTLTFGMNDSGYAEHNGEHAERFAQEQVEKSYQSFQEIQKRLWAMKDTRKIMIGTSPYDQTSKFNKDIFKNKNNTICRIIDFQRAAAQKNQWEFTDFNAPMVEINAKMQMQDSTFTICGNDRIHPDNDRHMVMAYLFLKAQGMLGKKVSDVCVDASNKKVIRCGNCKISAVKKQNGTLSFDYLAQSLPYPLDVVAHGWGFRRSQSDALKMIPSLMDELSDEHFTVQGLSGQYELSIDGVKIDTLTASQLASGVNLAVYRHAPQYQQALTVMGLNECRWEIERTFREYAWLQYTFFLSKGLLHANNVEAVAAYWKGAQESDWVKSKQEMYDKMIHKEVREELNKQMEALTDRIYQENKPCKRHFILRAV